MAQARIHAKVSDFLDLAGDQIVEQLTETRVRFDRDAVVDLLRRVDWPSAVEGAPRLAPEHLGPVADALLADRSRVLVAEADDSRSEVYTSRKLAEQEQAMLDTFGRMAGAGDSIVDEATRKDLIASFDKMIAKRREADDPDFRAAFVHLLQQGRAKIVEGPPGAHKGDLIALAAQAFRAAGHQGNGVVVTALSDRIAAQGASEAQAKAATVEQLIRQLKAPDGPIGKGGLILLDETGMLGSRQMAELMAAADQKGAFLYMFGDTKQLPPLTAGQPMAAFEERFPEATASLTRIYRQRNEYDRNATQDLRDGNALAALRSYEARGLFGFHESRAETLKQAAKAFAKWRAKDKNDDETGTVLTMGAEATAAVNLMVQDRLRKEGALGKERTVETADGPVTFAEGDQVVIRERLGDDDGVVYPGSTGRIKKMKSKKMVIALDGADRSVDLDTQDQPDVALSYAVELRQAQGIKAHRVFATITDRVDGPIMEVMKSRLKRKMNYLVDQTVYADVKALAEDANRWPERPLAVDVAELPKATAPTRSAKAQLGVNR